MKIEKINNEHNKKMASNNKEQYDNDDHQFDRELNAASYALTNDIQKMYLTSFITTFYTIICVMIIFICFYFSTKHFFASLFFACSLLALINRNRILHELQAIYAIEYRSM